MKGNMYEMIFCLNINVYTEGKMHERIFCSNANVQIRFLGPDCNRETSDKYVWNKKLEDYGKRYYGR